jgi:hypothetical protein
MPLGIGTDVRLAKSSEIASWRAWRGCASVAGISLDQAAEPHPCKSRRGMQSNRPCKLNHWCKSHCSWNSELHSTKSISSPLLSASSARKPPFSGFWASSDIGRNVSPSGKSRSNRGSPRPLVFTRTACLKCHSKSSLGGRRGSSIN